MKKITCLNRKDIKQVSTISNVVSIYGHIKNGHEEWILTIDQ